MIIPRKHRRHPCWLGATPKTRDNRTLEIIVAAAARVGHVGEASSEVDAHDRLGTQQYVPSPTRPQAWRPASTPMTT